MIGPTTTEPFRIAPGAVDIATAFTAYADCFGHVHFGASLWTQLPDEHGSPELRQTLPNARSGTGGEYLQGCPIGKGRLDFLQKSEQRKDSFYHYSRTREKILRRYRLNAKPGEDLSKFLYNG